MKNELVGVRFALVLAAAILCGVPAQRLHGAETAPVAATQGDFFCGPRCVQQALRHFGQRVDLYDLVSENRYDGSAQGASMSDLREMLARRGIHSLAVELPSRISKPWPGPMIAHLLPKSDGTIGHWVTVTPSDTAGEYLVFYGLRDTRILSWNELLAAASGSALLTSRGPIALTAVRASWPAMLSYAPAVGRCGLLALAAGFLATGWARGKARLFVTLPRFALALAGVAAVIGYTILFPTEQALRVLAASEMATLRGGAPVCGLTDPCWTSGPPQQCGTPYQAETCAQQTCPSDGDCSSEVEIMVDNVEVESVICALFPSAGKTAYKSFERTCSMQASCAAACTEPDPNGDRFCKSDNTPWGPASTDRDEFPDIQANDCSIQITDGHQENPRGRLSLIAGMNGLGL